MTEELKACPFDGGQAYLDCERLTSPNIPRTVYFITCRECEHSFFYASVNKEKIINKWNKRVEQE